MGRQRDDVLDRLRTKIVSGALSPGTTFSENEIAQEFGVSRTPVREAVAILVHEGLVEQIPQVGAVVKVHPMEEIQNMFKLRSVMEHLVVDDLRKRPVEQWGHVIEPILERMGRAAKGGHLADVVKADAEFHWRLAECSGYPLVAEFLRRFADTLRIVFGLELLHEHPAVEEIVQEHREIFEAVASGEGARVSEVLDRHLARGARRLNLVLGDGEGDGKMSRAKGDYIPGLRPKETDT